MDATYHIDFFVPDSSSHNAVKLTGMNLQNIIDESWGVTDVTIRALQKSEVPHPDTDAIARAFDASLDQIGELCAGIGAHFGFYSCLAVRANAVLRTRR